MILEGKRDDARWAKAVEERLNSALFAIALAAVLYAGFGILDRMLFPAMANSILPIRITVVSALVATIALLLASPATFVRHSQWILSSLFLACGLGIIVMGPMIGNPPYSDTYFCVGLNMVIAFLALVPLRFRYSALSCVALFIAYNASLFLQPLPLAVVLTNNCFLISTICICGLSNYQAERWTDLRFQHEELISQQRDEVEAQKKRADQLLHQILPDPIANRLMEGNQTIADGYSDVTVLFADLSGFTAFSTSVSPRSLVRILNRVFSAFDDIAEQQGVEKIKTIGDAYMAACGVPNEVDDHPERMMRMAIAMCEEMDVIRAELPQFPLEIRIGIHTGPCVAGVIGRQRLIYDLWGDTVNLASRMESTGLAGGIQVSESTYLRTRHLFDFECRGTVSVKGRGEMNTYLLLLPARANPTLEASP